MDGNEINEPTISHFAQWYILDQTNGKLIEILRIEKNAQNNINH